MGTEQLAHQPQPRRTASLDNSAVKIQEVTPKMDKDWHYTDLIKSHRLYSELEGRWRFYDAYMNSREPNAWLRSPDVPLREGILLFGWVHSWDPHFQGDLARFLQIYEDIFPILKRFEHNTIMDIEFTPDVKSSLCVIFDRMAMCCKTGRFESTDTSKILHGILPQLFVMWDERIRRNTVGAQNRDGRGYAYRFLPSMHKLAGGMISSYAREKQCDYESASQAISAMADNQTLAKLIDELNYLRFTMRRSLAQIRSVAL